jgi:hypothetical protein
VGAKRKCHLKTRGVVFNKQHVIPSRLNDMEMPRGKQKKTILLI